MNASDFNSSVLFIYHSSPNSTSEETVYERCIELPAVLIWYLCMQFTNMLLGLPSNLMVLWHIRYNKSDPCSSDIFIVHLAVLDALFLLIPPLELANIVFLNNSIMWYTLHFFYGIKDFSPLFLACICLDRYVAVIHPITFTKLKNRRHRTFLTVLVWFVILAYASAKCEGSVANLDKVFTGMILTVFAFMVFCNIVILWALKRSGPGRDDMHPVKKKAFKLVLIILAIIVFNYFPPVALFPFENYFSADVFLCYIHYVAFGLMDFSSTIQPVLYLFKKKVLMRLGCCQTHQTNTITAQTRSESREVWTLS